MEFKPLVGLDFEFFWQLINTLLIFLILRKLLFKPISNIVEKREKEIKKELESGKKSMREGEAFKTEYESKLKDVKNESAQIIEAAKKRAADESNAIIADAQREAEKIKSRAANEIEQEKVRAVREIKGDISNLVVLAASKVIEKDIDNQKHEELIEEFIDKVGEAR